MFCFVFFLISSYLIYHYLKQEKIANHHLNLSLTLMLTHTHPYSLTGTIGVDEFLVFLNKQKLETESRLYDLTQTPCYCEKQHLKFNQVNNIIQGKIMLYCFLFLFLFLCTTSY